ncbi:MAG: TolC family protein [Phycisphaeraceae bacterium]
MKSRTTWLALLAAGLAVSACAGPLDQSPEAALRESLIEAHRARLQQTTPGEIVEVERAPSEVERALSPQRREELDELSGPSTYEQEPLELGEDLQGDTDSPTVRVSLEEAVRLAVQRNLQAQAARLDPAIAETQIVQALAAFDASFFTTADWAKRDTPRPGGAGFGLAGDQQSEILELSTGIRQPLTTGGVASIETSVSRQEQTPTSFAVDRFYRSDVLLTLSQPLLRNFGTAVNRAEIRLAQSARAQQYENMVQTLEDIAFTVEQAYWDLVLARYQLHVQTRLLQRTITDWEQLRERAGFDVSPVRITEAASFVELRRADVIRARQNVRTAADQLKRLINTPELPLTSEILVLPTEDPATAPIEFSLLDAVRTALRHRPALQRTLLAIRDASIRLDVADNQLLPDLNVEAAVGFNGLGINSAADAYDQLDELNFIDYVLGAEFQYPLGNRRARARHKQARLERRQAVIQYRDAAQEVVLGVKNALRGVVTAYELIGATRAARRAAADNLRTIQEQEEAGVALTPEFLLDLKLQAQQRVADAEIQEMEARTQYATAIAQLYREMGTLLQRNRIEFGEPIEPTSLDQ